MAEQWVDEFNEAQKAKDDRLAALQRELEDAKKTWQELYARHEQEISASNAKLEKILENVAALQRDRDLGAARELELLEALRAVVAVADRETDEFIRARALIATAPLPEKHDRTI